jgi:hypothetical protein
VLDILATASDGLSAQQLNADVCRFAADYKGPKFYQLMGRLADAGLIVAWAQKFDVGGSSVSRTYYKLAPLGESAWRMTMQFYGTRMAVRKTLKG